MSSLCTFNYSVYIVHIVDIAISYNKSIWCQHYVTRNLFFFWFTSLISQYWKIVYACCIYNYFIYIVLGNLLILQCVSCWNWLRIFTRIISIRFNIRLLIITYNCVGKFIIVKTVTSNITSKHIFKIVYCRGRGERLPRMAEIYRDSIPGRDRPKSKVVTASLPNVRQQVRVSRVLGDDHNKGLACVTVGVAR